MNLRPLLVAILLMPLAGCHPDPKPAMAQCVAKAKADYPRAPDQTEEEYIDSLGSSVADCMEKAGYIFYPAESRCDDGSSSNPYCYTAKRRF
jgi:hypothetical protein